MAPKIPTIEERWKKEAEEGEGLHVMDEDTDPFLEDDSDLDLEDDDDAEDE